MSQEVETEMFVLPEADYVVEIDLHTFDEDTRTLYFELKILDSKYAGVPLHVYFRTAQADPEARKRQYAAYVELSVAACGYIVGTDLDIPKHLYGKRFKVHVGIRDKDGCEANVVETYMALSGPKEIEE